MGNGSGHAADERPPVFIYNRSMIKVGVPRALSYYRYFPLWKTLLESLGVEVVVSRPTGRQLLEEGVRHCVDDICVPVKLYYGHLLDLKDRADVIFVQRLVSVEKCESDTYTCPKLIGLPDMIKSSLEDIPPLVEFVVDEQNRSIDSSARALGASLGAPSGAVRKVLKAALEVQRRYEAELLAGAAPARAMEAVLGGGDGNGAKASGKPADLNIALIGHEYLLHDTYVSHDLPGKLARLGANVHYMTQVTPGVIERELEGLPGISWSFEKELLGAAAHFLSRGDIDGVMLVMCFACGPDSIISEMITREVKREDGPPLMNLVLDEHTGEAGVSTRVEAFLDMVRRSLNAR